MKLLFLIAMSALLATPAIACEAHGKNSKAKRKVASAADLSGADAKSVFEGLPGVADQLGDDVLGREGDLICYKKGDAYRCSVRGEDEESGSVEGAAAKRIYEKLSKAYEYEDGDLGRAREAAVSCLEKGSKEPFKHSCKLNY